MAGGARPDEPREETTDGVRDDSRVEEIADETCEVATEDS